VFIFWGDAIEFPERKTGIFHPHRRFDCVSSRRDGSFDFHSGSDRLFGGENAILASRAAKQQEYILFRLQQIADILEVSQMKEEVHLVTHLGISRQSLSIRIENQLSDKFAGIEQPNAGDESI
jgi:hypothetical protein